ncbi:MAG: hypothetical protein AB8F94_02765, partial [Saprospiraceae bacterium]
MYCFFSCGKEEVPLADLNFQVEEIDGVYHCSWTATNISTFEKYYIVHSPLKMENEDEPSESFSYRWTSVYSQATNSISIDLGGEEDLTLYFQLFVDIGDRMIRSKMIVFEKGISEVIDIDARQLISFSEKNAIYFYNKNSGQVCYYDYLENKIKAEAELVGGIKLLAVGNNGFGDEIYGVLGQYEL